MEGLLFINYFYTALGRQDRAVQKVTDFLAQELDSGPGAVLGSLMAPVTHLPLLSHLLSSVFVDCCED